MVAVALDLQLFFWEVALFWLGDLKFQLTSSLVYDIRTVTLQQRRGSTRFKQDSSQDMDGIQVRVSMEEEVVVINK